MDASDDEAHDAARNSPQQDLNEPPMPLLGEKMDEASLKSFAEHRLDGAEPESSFLWSIERFNFVKEKADLATQVLQTSTQLATDVVRQVLQRFGDRRGAPYLSVDLLPAERDKDLHWRKLASRIGPSTTSDEFNNILSQMYDSFLADIAKDATTIASMMSPWLDAVVDEHSRWKDPYVGMELDEDQVEGFGWSDTQILVETQSFHDMCDSILEAFDELDRRMFVSHQDTGDAREILRERRMLVDEVAPNWSELNDQSRERLVKGLIIDVLADDDPLDLDEAVFERKLFKLGCVETAELAHDLYEGLDVIKRLRTEVRAVLEAFWPMIYTKERRETEQREEDKAQQLRTGLDPTVDNHFRAADPKQEAQDIEIKREPDQFEQGAVGATGGRAVTPPNWAWSDPYDESNEALSALDQLWNIIEWIDALPSNWMTVCARPELLVTMKNIFLVLKEGTSNEQFASDMCNSFPKVKGTFESLVDFFSGDDDTFPGAGEERDEDWLEENLIVIDDWVEQQISG